MPRGQTVLVRITKPAFSLLLLLLATSTGKWFDAVCFNQLREVDAQADIATMQIADDELLYKCVEVNRTEEDSHDSVMHILRFPAARNLTALDADLGGEILFFRQDDLDLFD
eukprot:2326853-Prorocentrum_lima.AAC.1